MSQSDSFIEEVTEEVRRDQLYAYARRYGWIAAAVVLVIIGAVAYSEWRGAQAEQAAQTAGDAILAAIAREEDAARAAALAELDGGSDGAEAVIAFLQADALSRAGEAALAAAELEAVATNGALPEIYRQIASFKALTLSADTMDADARRAGFEALAVPGAPLRLLAQEQLALMDVAAGNTDAAIAALTAILQDAERTRPLQDRALQVMVALGVEPDLEALGLAGN